MNNDNTLAGRIKGKDFIVTAEYFPRTAADDTAVKEVAGSFLKGLAAVNVADNPFGVVLSSLAASVALIQSGVEPVYQVVTRDRNRIALQSDLMGAASLGIKNVVCLSGYHQTLTKCSESANVYDIDSIQLIAALRKMCEDGELLDGTKIEGTFFMLAGAVANPYLEPMELNIMRLAKKVEAGASFIQTQAVFDTEVFSRWLNEADREGITDKAAVLAGVLPLESSNEAEKLRETYTDFRIPDQIVKRLKAAGDPASQKKEGLTICAETIQKLKDIKGLRGIHILSGGKEEIVPELIAAAGL